MGEGFTVSDSKRDGTRYCVEFRVVSLGQFALASEVTEFAAQEPAVKNFNDGWPATGDTIPELGDATYWMAYEGTDLLNVVVLLSKHVDFLLFDPQTMRLMAGIELDGKSRSAATGRPATNL